jgi:hypothetical protein
LDLQLPMQSVPITTNVVSLISTQAIQHSNMSESILPPPTTAYS